MQSPGPTPGPPLKWAGGKRWQLGIIRELWAPHQHRRLIEPFCGGLSIALGLRPDHALLNDRSPHLINFYRWLQRGLLVNRHFVNQPEAFYASRERFNRLVVAGQHESREAAILFYYLNRTAYNGLCRFNQRGLFNVPFGRYSTIRYCYDFSAYRAALSRWTFLCGDGGAVPVEASDFIYADPPYDVPFTHYVPGGFRWEDQERLAHTLAIHPGPVVLVNQATDRVGHLYRRLGFSLQCVVAPRRISCTRQRTPVREILATRNL